MPRGVDQENDWDDDEPDWGSSNENPYIPPEERGEPTISCPYCSRDIHDDSVQCPYCGQYLSEEDAGPQEDEASRHKPWWIIIGALLALYVVYRWIVPP